MTLFTGTLNPVSKRRCQQPVPHVGRFKNLESFGPNRLRRFVVESYAAMGETFLNPNRIAAPVASVACYRVPPRCLCPSALLRL